jgi:MFS family permease
MLEPAARAVIRSTFSPEQHRVAFGLQRASVFAGAALGPILSGCITTVFSWRYLFWLNLLLAATVVAGAVLLLPASRASQTGRRFDLPGLLLGAPGLFFLMFPLIEGARLGWRSPAVVGSFVLSGILLALFVVTERQVRDPLAPLMLFHDRLFAVGNMLRGVTEFASLGVFFVLSHFLQVQLGYSALVTGLLLMSIIGGALVTSPIAEALVGRVDVRWLVIPGFVLVAMGTFWVAHVSPETGWVFFIAPLAVAGAGFGALESPTTSAMQRHIMPAQEEAAWRVSYTVYLLGIGLGVAVVSAVWQNQLVEYVHETLFRINLPPAMVNRFVSSVLAGGSRGSGTAYIEALIQQAFAHAINAALLSCVAVAVLGAIVALFFSSGQVHGNNGTNVE